MPAYDWSTFRLKININAPVDKVFSAWTSGKSLERWFLRRALVNAKARKIYYLPEISLNGIGMATLTAYLKMERF